MEDLKVMTIGSCLDYAEDYLELKQSDGEGTREKPRVRKATQKDFDAF